MDPMTTLVLPPSSRARLPEAARLPVRDDYAAERALAELFPHLQSAADAALAELFPMLRLRPGAARR